MIRLAVAIMAVAAVVAFGWGFAHLLSDGGSSPKYGVIAGIGSAVAWAIGSSFGNSFLGYTGRPTLNNWFNAFAAAFAALSLGYLTPANALCRPSYPYELRDRAILLGRSPALRPLCSLRSVDDSAYSVSDLWKEQVLDLQDSIRELSRQIAGARRSLEGLIKTQKAAADEMNGKIDALQKVQQTDRSDEQKTLAALSQRVERLEHPLRSQQQGRNQPPHQ